MTELENKELDNLTVMGGWRLLCIATLHGNVRSLIECRQRQNPRLYRNADVIQMREYMTDNERWMEGGVGAITFEDCCECLGVRPEVARAKIKGYVRNNQRKSLDELFGW